MSGSAINPRLGTEPGHVRDSDHCSSKVFLPGYTKVILHANNVFLQGVADQGLLTFALTSIALTLIFQRLFIGLYGDIAPFFRTCLACALFILASYLVELRLLKTTLQQVVSGYLLAIAWGLQSAPSQLKSHSISSS